MKFILKNNSTIVLLLLITIVELLNIIKCQITVSQSGDASSFNMKFDKHDDDDVSSGEGSKGGNYWNDKYWESYNWDKKDLIFTTQEPNNIGFKASTNDPLNKQNDLDDWW
jgi:hypothetical protein